MAGSDYWFAWEHAESPNGPWAHLEVLWFRGHEAMSELFRYEVTLLAKSNVPGQNADIPLSKLIGARAALRIRTYTNPAYRMVHGVITEAEDVTSVPEGMVYRVVLMPPFVRANHRQRSRIFLDKPIRKIIDTVIENDPNYQRVDGIAADPVEVASGGYMPAKDRFTWRISDSPRIDAATTRPFCVEYMETDHNFVSRLLEDEGIAYHFEHGEDTCILVLSDRDAGRTKLDPFDPLGMNIQGRAVQTVKLGARMRPTRVRLHEYNWRKPSLDMGAQAETNDPDKAGLFEDHYPGGYFDSPNTGAPLANARIDRLAVEAEYATFASSCRLLGAGQIFDLDFPKPKYEGQYLITNIQIYGEQAGASTIALQAGLGEELLGKPYECRFECARRTTDLGGIHESRFRPARSARRPRIFGSQTAFVTAEPGSLAEINVGGPLGDEIGCVRLRFLWDKEDERLAKEPSSCWIRVSQFFAGAGQGAVFHPRVGVEVIVEYLEGDPDRPIVTGRVYNGQNRPPVVGKGAATESTMKTFSSPGGGNFNEIYFQDAAGREQIRLEASRNYDMIVDNDRSEAVNNDGSSDVGNNRSESTGVNRSTSVGSNNMEIIGMNESVAVGANQSVSVGMMRTMLVGANHMVQVGADQDVTIGANDTLTVGATQTITVGATQTITVGAAQSTTIGGGAATSVGGASTTNSGGAMAMAAGGAMSLAAPTQDFVAAGSQALQSTTTTVTAAAMASIAAGAMSSNAAPFVVQEAGGVLALSGPVTIMNGGTITISGGTVQIEGSTITVNGGSVKVDGGGQIDMSAGLIKLN
ncbi:MAG: type VI secretion system tip protein VgrG [Polyangiaceae bacterium]|nr:type VI secretion system tip protein VgrG [Polyangiaceae bacterium]